MKVRLSKNWWRRAVTLEEGCPSVEAGHPGAVAAYMDSRISGPTQYAVAPFDTAPEWYGPFVAELNNVTAALDKLALVVPERFSPLKHEAQTVRDAFAGRKRALEAMLDQSQHGA